MRRASVDQSLAAIADAQLTQAAEEAQRQAKLAEEGEAGPRPRFTNAARVERQAAIRREELRLMAPREYLETSVFPALLPGLEELLRAVKKNEGTHAGLEVDPVGWLARFLYRHNPMHPEVPRAIGGAQSQEELLGGGAGDGDVLHAATKIQSAFRGFATRKRLSAAISTASAPTTDATAPIVNPATAPQ